MRPPEPIASEQHIEPPRDRYTLDGDEQVEARIAADQERVAAAVAEVVPAQHFMALVLMGGYGRGEGGYVHRQTEHGLVPAPYNDYDYFVVVRRTHRAQRRQLAQRLSGAAKRLEHLLGVEVDFALLRNSRLGRAERSLMNAEMCWGHRVVAGNPDVLRKMPRMPFPTVAPAELTRLLLNRGALLLMNERQLRGSRAARHGRGTPSACPAVQPEVFFKYLGKAVLACGDALLAMNGCYHPSYPVKLARLEAFQQPGSSNCRGTMDAFFARDEPRFMALYRFAYQHKFHPDYEALNEESAADWQAEVRRLWLETLRAFEHYRLGQPVNSWADYCGPEIPKGQIGGRGGVLRNGLITLRDYGVVELLRQPRWALRYPRERLIATLPLLLTDVGDRPDPCVCTALGLPYQTSWLEATQEFLQAWHRYA